MFPPWDFLYFLISCLQDMSLVRWGCEDSSIWQTKWYCRSSALTDNSGNKNLPLFLTCDPNGSQILCSSHLPDVSKISLVIFPNQAVSYTLVACFRVTLYQHINVKVVLLTWRLSLTLNASLKSSSRKQQQIVLTSGSFLKIDFETWYDLYRGVLFFCSVITGFPTAA